MKKTPGLFLCPDMAAPADTISAGVLKTEGSPRVEGDRKKRNRPDHDGPHRLAFDRNKKRIFASQNICGICGQPVDMSLKYPHPLSPSIDHIVPIDQGGHASDINNLQLAHWKCNRMKGNKLIFPISKTKQNPTSVEMVDTSNRNLPLSMDWSAYKAKT